MNRPISALCLMIAASAVPNLVHASQCGSQSALPKEARVGHRLQWETKSEVLSLGFDVMRSTTMDGTFTKVNAEPLPAAKFSAKVRPYEYVDDSIDPCLTYYYYVDAISQDGIHTKVSPTMMAKPKMVVIKQ